MEYPRIQKYGTENEEGRGRGEKGGEKERLGPVSVSALEWRRIIGDTTNQLAQLRGSEWV
jgi:hypothetical protein